MEIRWRVSKRDGKRVRDFVRSHGRDAFVRKRFLRNVKGPRRLPTKSRAWAALATALLTTQQRSGPQSPIFQLIRQRPFPLRWSVIGKERRSAAFIAREIRKTPGIRRADTIGLELSHNRQWFEPDGWRELRGRLAVLTNSRGHSREREVANWLTSQFRGLGPKQSRNFLQLLGLTKYEIPIDSRITKWLNEFGFPVTLDSRALSDPGYYAFVCDGVRELSKAAGVYPCVLDAVVFSMADGDAWNEVDVVF